MKRHLSLPERLRDLYDKYEDQEIARCVIMSVDMRNELQRTRFDRMREWALLVFVSAYIVHTVWVEIVKWL